MSRGASLLVATFVAAQIAIPILLLGARWSNEGSMPTTEYPFSWQMYSTVTPGTYTGTAADGSQRDLTLDGLPLVTRAIAYTDEVPRLLCARHPDLTSVTRSGGEDGLLDHQTEYPC